MMNGKVSKTTGTTKPSRGKAKSQQMASKPFKAMKKKGMSMSKKASY